MREYANPAADRTRPYGESEREVLSHAGAATARREIATWPGYAPTPLRSLPALARRLEVAAAFYKDEDSRFGLHSFKALGGSYGVFTILREEIRRSAGVSSVSSDDLLAQRYRSIIGSVVVTTATDGNHGRSVAWGARLFGCRAVIFLPKGVSAGREHAIRELGAEIIRVDADYDGAVRKCAAEAAARGWFVVSDTSYDGYETIPRHVMQGYTVLGAELLEQLPRDEWPTHLFLQAGVGGLAAAVVAHLWEAYPRQRPTTVIVEPSSADCLFQTALAGELTRASGDLDTVMAGLSCGLTSPLAWRILRPGADVFMTIPDDIAVRAMRMLAEGLDGDPPIVAGESAVAGVAGAIEAASDARLRRTVGLDGNSRVLFIGTEGATDPAIYAELVGG
ncbi:MAG TPA: diaminopropionate ammonia-lyase [Gemmatimonadaceae bacterium]|nr:diaminopropionate ammonia-lyase [Gemmatimonadaceae bacterium]